MGCNCVVLSKLSNTDSDASISSLWVALIFRILTIYRSACARVISSENGAPVTESGDLPVVPEK